MIKIISEKKWEEMNQELIDLQMDLGEAKKDNDLLEKQVDYLRKKIEEEKENAKELSFIGDKSIDTIYNLKVEIKKLKTLLTQNKIDYKSVLNKKKVK